jgi:hypothetical protein
VVVASPEALRTPRPQAAVAVDPMVEEVVFQVVVAERLTVEEAAVAAAVAAVVCRAADRTSNRLARLALLM